MPWIDVFFTPVSLALKEATIAKISVLPDSIADEKVLKRSFEKNTKLVENANLKVVKAVAHIKNGKYPQEGLGTLSRLAVFGHRDYGLVTEPENIVIS